jgi:sigma-E factor negative regulatory protein RseC
MDKTISHQGIVEQISGYNAKVRILSQSACAACHTKGACSVSDTAEKIIDATFTGTFKTGDLVTIVTQHQNGLKAVFWGYVLPFLLVLTVLIILQALNYPETISGLLSLAALGPYYLGLFMFKRKLQHTFKFEIKNLA